MLHQAARLPLPHARAHQRTATAFTIRSDAFLVISPVAVADSRASIHSRYTSKLTNRKQRYSFPAQRDAQSVSRGNTTDCDMKSPSMEKYVNFSVMTVGASFPPRKHWATTNALSLKAGPDGSSIEHLLLFLCSFLYLSLFGHSLRHSLLIMDSMDYTDSTDLISPRTVLDDGLIMDSTNQNIVRYLYHWHATFGHFCHYSYPTPHTRNIPTLHIAV